HVHLQRRRLQQQFAPGGGQAEQQFTETGDSRRHGGFLQGTASPRGRGVWVVPRRPVGPAAVGGGVIDVARPSACPRGGRPSAACGRASRGDYASWARPKVPGAAACAVCGGDRGPRTAAAGSSAGSPAG